MRRVNRHGGGEVAASKRALPVVWVLAGLFLRLFLRGRPRSMAGATVSGLTLRVVGGLRV
jgi:hypothetical protein